jgi:non-specific serine/threonine protein kinase/serine/threonine-protein kinase
MKPERSQQVEQLFQAAVEREESQRAAFLAEACGGDAALRREVESLLAQDRELGSFLESPALDDVAKAMAGEEEQQGGVTEPKSIGPYRLVKKLGEGGMGQVWLAEQTAPLRRTVALKLIRAGMYDNSLLQRFQAERQSLAIMDHPSIAKVFEAGATAEGQPYFVMEYVPGAPITDYCDEKRLKIRERLELFIKVCEAVQHAHQKAIIHRDLKPANILVVEVDGQPTARIIDFGLAKATSRELGDDLSVTRAGGFVGTPGYMSPEQADPSTQDIDTRTDVYSLGVVLYLLFTGSLPHETKEWKNLPYDEVLRHLREDDPVRPSTRVSTDRETSTEIAECRQTEPKQLVSQLRGDLDWIAMKALERDRNRRYATPLGFATDIEHFLRNEPVVAAPPGTLYWTRKYVRRHRVGVAVGAGLMMLLVAFTVAQASQLRRTERERDRANRITAFMTNMFKVSDPSQARGNTITAREILDKASKDIDTELTKDPELQAQMLNVMGTVYFDLGLYQRAQSLLGRAVDLQRHVLGPESPDTLRSMSGLAMTLYHQGQYANAEKLERQALDVQRRRLGPEHPDTLLSLAGLADDLASEGHYREAQELLRQTLEIERRVRGPRHPDTLTLMNDLAWVLEEQGHYPDAEKLQRETLDARRHVLGPENPDTLESMTKLSWTLIMEGRYAEAESLERQTLDVEKRVLGPEHPRTLESMFNLATALSEENRYGEAEKLYRGLLEIQRRVLGPEHPDTLIAMSNLSAALVGERHYMEAEMLLRHVVEIQRRDLGPDHPKTASSTFNLALAVALKGDSNEALLLLRQAVDHGLRPKLALGIETDPDLQSLHGDPRFGALVSYARQKAAAAQKPN